MSDVPKLQPHPGLEKKEEEEEEEEYDEGSNLKRQTNKNRVQSGPRTPNPYASDNSSLMFPILVAFGVFIPTLFCLCRLWEHIPSWTGWRVWEGNQTCWFWFLYFSQWLTNKQKTKTTHKKLKEKKRGRVGREQPPFPTGPSPALFPVLSLWLAPAISFLSRVLRVKRILHSHGSSSAHLVERTLNPEQTWFLFLGLKLTAGKCHLITWEDQCWELGMFWSYVQISFQMSSDWKCVCVLCVYVKVYNLYDKDENRRGIKKKKRKVDTSLLGSLSGFSLMMVPP